MDLTQLSVDELVAKQQEIGAQIDALREERRAYADEVRRRMSVEGQAQAAVDALSPEALELLKAKLGVVAVAQPIPEVPATPAQ